MYKRIVIKLSGEALASGDDKGITNIYDDKTIDNLIKDIKNTMSRGTQVALVIGGGNILRGRSTPGINRAKADQIGMLATVMNSIYLAERFKENGIHTEVLTPFEVGNFTKVYSREKALKYLNQNKLLIFGGGLGHPYFSTDTIPALRALELECDCVLFAKNVDGIYNKNPAIHKDATKYKTITYRKIIEDNLYAIDIAAMVLCENGNIPSLVFSLNQENAIELAALNSEEFYKFGTRIVTNNQI